MKYCAVHTLLKVTNANVCKNMVLVTSRLAKSTGIKNPDRKSCGKNAHLEGSGINEVMKCKKGLVTGAALDVEAVTAGDDEIYKSVL